MGGILNYFSNLNKTETGIVKDAPPKNGLSLFVDIFRREWWNLIKLNFLFFIFCIPLISKGPATAAMIHVTMKMVQDQNVDLWHDYKNAFMKNIKQGFILEAIIIILSIIVATTTYFYFQNLAENYLLIILLVTNLSLIILFLLSYLYVYPQIVLFKLSTITVLKNAVLLGIICLKHSFPAILIIVGFILVPIILPSIIPLIIIIYFSCISLIICIASWPDINKYLLDSKTLLH